MERPANDNRGKGETIAMIGIDYDEFHPETFRSVFVSIDGDRTDFTTWDSALLFASEHADKIFNLSSVDNFGADRLALPSP